MLCFRYALSMGLAQQYRRVGQSAKNSLFGISPFKRGPSLKGDRVPLTQMLLTEQGHISQGEQSTTNTIKDRSTTSAANTAGVARGLAEGNFLNLLSFYLFLPFLEVKNCIDQQI